MSTRTRYVVGIVLVVSMVLSVVAMIMGPQNAVGSSPLNNEDHGPVVPAILHLSDD